MILHGLKGCMFLRAEEPQIYRETGWLSVSVVHKQPGANRSIITCAYTEAFCFIVVDPLLDLFMNEALITAC